ncbi:MAG: GNAT family N-acetyltransferase [Cyclobacteriaceae bacterium]|nr:GNAT family N-acetyltransferase [Cyclobacteriaceae bacterium]
MERLDLDETFETERLIFRRLMYEDAEEIFYAYASKPEATRYVSWATHRSVADTQRFLMHTRAAWAAGTDYSFSIRLKNTHRLVGSIGALNEYGKIQFGYIISPAHWNKGYATEATRRFMELLAAQRGVYRIGTLVDVANVASQRVLEKSGLVEEARLTRWLRFVNQNNEPRDCILYRYPLPERIP